MKRNQKVSFLKQFAASLMLSALLALNLAPLKVMAVDVQSLPDTVAAVSGFTHAARITFDDMNNADISALVVQLFPIPTNSYIDRVGWYVEESFTNALFVPTLGATNMVLTIGVGGTTNAFFGSNTLTYANTSLSTNMLVPYKATTSTNYLIACFSDALQAANLDGYLVGKIRIYFRVVHPVRYRF